MDLRCGTSTSLSTVMKPHMKNNVVTTVNATLFDEAGAVVVGAGEGVLTLVIAIIWGARQVDLIDLYEFGFGFVQAS